MGWTSNNDELQVEKKEGMEATTKVLIGIISCLIMIIIVIAIILVTKKETPATVIVNGKERREYDIKNIVVEIDGITYINIKDFSKVVDYEYHNGEYKSFTNDKDKCYITGKDETATFYLNENKIYKLPINNNSQQEEYRECTVKENVLMKNDVMYASINAMKIACNVDIVKADNTLKIYTLDYIEQSYNNNVKKWGYEDITNQKFENKKAILYDRLIVKKEDGLYKIVNCKNTTEIIPDKYKQIQFSEEDKTFFVESSIGKFGIVSLDGDVLIEPKYDSISVFDKQKGLYLVAENNKFGLMKFGNIEVIATQYDKIGCDTSEILVNNITKKVNPVITIDECNGVVLKKDNKYGIVDLTNNTIIVPFQVDNIYSVENENKELEYFMLYNGEELNIIDMLVEQGIIKNTNIEQ